MILILKTFKPRYGLC